MAQITVAGFHRSGTSLLMQLLQRAGLFVGNELIGAMPSNPYGHFEDREFVRLHDALLSDNGRTWHVDTPFVPYIAADRWRQMGRLVDRRETAHALWGFKDPRSAFFLHGWKHLLPDLRTVVVYRNWADCAYSLERRQSIDLFLEQGPTDLHRLFWKVPDHALRMWIEYNRSLVRYARAYPDDTLVVALTDLEEGFDAITRINTAWALGLHPIPATEVFDPTAMGSRPGRQPLSRPETAEELHKTWRDLETMADVTQQRIVEARASRHDTEHADAS